MESVSIKNLKRSLAKWTQKAAKGQIIEVTKHNHPYVHLVAPKTDGLIWGKNVGKAHLRPVLKKPLKINWQKFWDEDRNED